MVALSPCFLCNCNVDLYFNREFPTNFGAPKIEKIICQYIIKNNAYQTHLYYVSILYANKKRISFLDTPYQKDEFSQRQTKQNMKAENFVFAEI